MSVLDVFIVVAAVAIAVTVVSFVTGFVKSWRDDPDPLTGAEIRTALRYLPWYVWRHRPRWRSRP